ncbi:MAG TPA: SRPBCC family protein [Armatimonadota bacterium]|nr:SRPBCC family protein [Armatimonadota bacterium]
MPRVESSVIISGPVDRVFALARDIEAFPQFMPDLKKVTILERSPDGSRTVSEFVGYIRDFRITIKWVEEDEWDEQAKTCKFKLVKGDFKNYSGLWTFEPVDGGTKYTSVIDFEYEIPLIGPIIKSLVAKLMKQNVDNMLMAVKNKVESG